MTPSTESYVSLKRSILRCDINCQTNLLVLPGQDEQLEKITGTGYVLMHSYESLARLSPYIVVEPSDTKLSAPAIPVDSRKAQKFAISFTILQ